VAYPARTDADGHYSKTDLQPEMTYTIQIRRPDTGKDPLRLANGEIPSVQVGHGSRRFDIPLATPEKK
jgi:hypothetical protein